MLSALFSVAAAFLLLPEVSAAQNAKPAEKLPPPCTVSGRVVTAAEGTAIKSSRVALIPERKSAESQVYASLSDSTGRFTIKNIPAGRYRFLASHTGYVDLPYQSSGGDTGAVLALHAGQEVKDVLFRMTLSGVITGRVNDEDGEPMALIQVVALRRPTNEELEDQEQSPWGSHELQPAGFSQTDDRGQYRIFGLKPGEYYIKAIDEYEPTYPMATDSEMEVRKALGSQYAPVYYPGVMQMGQAQAVSLTAGEESQADFIMRRTHTVDISGRVIGADGKPADAFLYLEDLAAAEFGVSHTTETDSKGEFKMKGVAPGSYTLHAQQHSSEDAIYHANQKIDVGSDNIDSITLAMGRGVNVSGRIEVSGRGTVQLERIYINLISSDGQTADAWGPVKKDGTFNLLDVSEGTYAVSVHGLDQTWHVKSVRLGTDDVLAKGLEIEKGQASGTIQIAVSNSGAELAGSVMQDDKPVLGARVRINPEPPTRYNRLLLRTTNTDQGGRFSFAGLAPGQYLVTAKIPGETQANASSDAKSVDLSEHDHNNIDLTIPPPPKQ
jgi:protocatechuate 3,4-dioxygenase beta subunit